MRLLVHLGTDPGSKAYQMYDPQTQKIVVSRDVVFDETKRWNWLQNSSEQSMDGSFSITLGEFGNHGIQKDQEFSSGEVAQQRIGETSGFSNGEDTPKVVTIDDDDEGEEDETEVIIRRSTRQTSKPKYLDDYVLLAEEEGEYLLMCLNNEPRNYEEAR